MAQALHTAHRRRRPDGKDSKIPSELNTLADLLITDIEARRLPPNHVAHLHLLSFFKEARQFDKGFQFWEWLVEQDDAYVSPSVYGAAIELAAVQGRPADETEALYAQALKRFPGSFNEYHLSPDAVLSDRSQPFNVKGIPITLLQGIVTARLLRGDSKNAYLALDTALRLFPTQIPSRFFTLFLQERPVTEAYKVLMIACRAGAVLNADALKALLTKLRHVAVAAPLANHSALRALITASYAYASSGGTLTSSHLTEVVVAVTNVLQDPSIAHLAPDHLSLLTDHVMDVIRKLFAVWETQNARPSIAAFNSIIINVASRGRPDIAAMCLRDMEDLGLRPSIVTYRSLLAVAGETDDVGTLHSAWAELVYTRRSAGTPIELQDWLSLAKAAAKIAQHDFVAQELSAAGDSINPGMLSRIEGQLQNPAHIKAVDETASDKSASGQQAAQLLDAVFKDALYMEERLPISAFRNYKNDPLPISIVNPNLNAAEEQLRTIYDELTADANEGRASNDAMDDGKIELGISQLEATDARPAPAISSTGLTYAELRYENWKTLNELLAEAERYDSDYVAAVDAAIQNGTLPPKRSSGWHVSQSDNVSVGLSDIHGSIPEKTEAIIPSRDSEIREAILRLRGRSG